MKCLLSPSILSADFGILAQQVKACDDAGAEYIHIDVMDGMFVPQISMGIPIVSSIRKYTDKILDVHLMIEEPDRYVADFAKAGADIITVHAEACKHLDATINHIKDLDVMAGVAINPATPVSDIKLVLPKVDMAVIMSVNPGFGGQKMIPYTLDKIRELADFAKKNNLKFDIEVDGGVKENNIDQFLDAGANIIVAGSAVFSGDIAGNVESLLAHMAD